MHGLLRKPSPTRKQEIVSNIRNESRSRPIASVISHNQNVSPNIQDSMDLDGIRASRYSTPQLNTALSLALMKNELLHASRPTVTNTAALTPNTKAAVTSKALKKLNIPAAKTVFKQLEPVNVNDSVLGLDRPQRRSKSKKDFHSTVDPEPNLQYYLKPAKPLQHIIQEAERAEEKKKPADSSQSLNQFADECFTNLRDTYDEYLRPQT